MSVNSPFAQIQDSLPPLTPAPQPISAADLIGLGGGQSVPSGVFASAPKVSLDQNPAHQIRGAFDNGNPSEAISLHQQQKLAKDYAADNQQPTTRLAKAGRVFQDIGNAVLPGLMERIPGTELHRQGEEMGLQKSLQELLKEQSQEGLENATAAHTNAETPEVAPNAESARKLQGAEAGHVEAETEALKNPQGDYEVHDTAEGPMVVNKKTGVGQHLSANGLPIGPKVQTKVVQLQIGGKDHQVLVNDADGTVIRDMGEGGVKPTQVNLGTWSLQNDTSGKPILFNSKTGETKDAPSNLARKPNAEELKRNDLAGNVNENLDSLQDIVNRRPELFGPMSGRMTELREKLGTNDPDVAKLKTIEDNLGMALQSAHGMRSAQHVATSAQSVLNGLHNEPHALSAAIKTARDSVGTFQHDVQNTNEAGRAEGAPVAETQQFSVNGKTYNIPADKVAEFKKEFPNAR
jgi:hypothetical protein